MQERIRGYNYYQAVKTPSSTQKLIAGISAVFNMVLGMFVGYIIISRHVAIIQEKELATIDWFILFGGLGLVLIKFGIAIWYALMAFTEIVIPINRSILKCGAIFAVVVNLSFFAVYLTVMIVLGPIDPSGLTWNYFLVASIVLFLEFLTALMYLCCMDYTVEPMMMAYGPQPLGYSPVIQYY